MTELLSVADHKGSWTREETRITGDVLVFGITVARFTILAKRKATERKSCYGDKS